MLINTKRQYIYSLVLLILAISSFIFVTYAWYTTKFAQTLDYDPDMGYVDVDIRVYFDDGSSTGLDASEVQISPTQTKPGVYYVNIDNEASDQYIENLRVSILTESNIHSYIRVKILKQLTLTYTDYLGDVTELSVYMSDDVLKDFRLYYDLENWYIDSTTKAYYIDANGDIRDSSGIEIYTLVSTGIFTDTATETETYYLKTGRNLEDAETNGNLIILGTNILDSQSEAIDFENRYFQYIYYKSSVNSLYTIPLIVAFPESVNFGSYPNGYSLQIAFQVEAVQGLGGPENMWGLSTPPWGGSW
ncbi:MAG: hypothetical protein WC152_06425 [Candidatus Izemoplasmatales bacterium]